MLDTSHLVSDDALASDARRPWQLSIEDAFAAFASTAAGLAHGEADARLARDGPNELAPPEAKALWRLIAGQFTNVPSLLLLGAAVLSIVLGKPFDAWAILTIVVLFAGVGAYQEHRAEHAIAALQKMTVPTVRVTRAGRIAEMPARLLVSGDLVELTAGGFVPADIRLVTAASLRVEEAALTGESEPVEKHVNAIPQAALPPGDRLNMAFMGTAVTQGRGMGIVVATGMRTELGRIAGLLQTVPTTTTPLQQRLDATGRHLAVAGAAAAALVFALGVVLGERPADMLLSAVSVAVAVIPEGLPAVVTFTLAVGAQRMMRRHALIRRLPAVEALGSVTVICSDKTGTLTENRMSVMSVDLLGRTLDLDSRHPEGIESLPAPVLAQLRLLLASGALCNDAQLPRQDSAEHAMGDPTEVALLVAATRLGFTRETLEHRYPRLSEMPFDSDRKRMTTIHRHADHADGPMAPLWRDRGWDGHVEYVAITKGAVDRLLETATAALVNGVPAPLHPEVRAIVVRAHDALANAGLRVIGVAVRSLSRPEPSVDVESGLTLVGLFGLMDPPRAEARDAIETCGRAGIRPMMITGDHPLTAQVIAGSLGIGGSRELAPSVVTGSMLESLDPEALRHQVARTSVYARVSPAHKLDIVRALQANGEVVAMTGDGVNDAPALKAAHIGVAMGITGTDVAKASSDMVLRDDNFASIVAAVEEGRVAYDNVRRFVAFAVAGNIGKVAVMLGWPLALVVTGTRLDDAVALQPIQLLWLNLMTDGVLGLSMGVEPAQDDVMRRPPRRVTDGLLADGAWRMAVWVGLLIAALTIAIGTMYYRAGSVAWQTMMFSVLATLQVCQALAARSSRRAGGMGWLPSRGMAVAIAVVLMMHGLALFSRLGDAMNVTPLDGSDVLVCAVAGAGFLLALEFVNARSRTNP